MPVRGLQQIFRFNLRRVRGLAHTVRAVIFPMAVGAIALAAIGLGIPSTVQAEDEMKIEVTITDKGYDVTGHTTTELFNKDHCP